ncbi:hypothetical protein COCVIDRAFT_40329 [Bipolaris victoriae FI3]|uniref:Uncharacterized protein n=2 Tax=Bipolaris TaxID=33194 RepID=W6XYB7_COCC2|nr:uncharacterized protein COCCADRAFT_39100 [Bipolaris zeicola 26-R-13]XP_014553680.1 hypothetical protein COCVIDRAFT_40329 [Bipolaris victoriae FI3]EUC30718.1 hypothetical protein COCCADRAFT_39100 [Bipolaris zeicola 26-R-13]
MTTRLPQLVNCTDTMNFRGVTTDQHRRNFAFDATHLRTTLGRSSAYSCNIVYADMKFFFDLIVILYSPQTEPIALAVEAKASASFA